MEPIARHHSRHAGAAIVTRHFYAVDDRFADILPGADRVRHLCRRYILTLPSKRLSNTIDEIEEPRGVASHQVAAAKPRVARREHVTENFPGCRCMVGVAIELQ